MKRIIAIWLAAGMLMMGGALAEAADASRLPAPEEVAAIESAEEDRATETATPAGEGEEAPEATEIPEAEPTPEAGAPGDAEPGDAEPTEAAEPTPEPEDSQVWFEEGFGLTFPGGWVSYPVAEEDRESGVRYALGDGTGERSLYIQFKPTGAADVTALSEAVENTESLSKTGDLSFGGTNFVTFIDARQNASCCATIWGGEMLAFVFTPQSDSDFMLTASRLMESFKIM